MKSESTCEKQNRKYSPSESMRTWLLISSTFALIAAASSKAGILAGPVTNAVNGHVYYLLTPSTWTAAEAEALSLGGHLATINNGAEDAWVYDTFASYGNVPRALWIGLTDRDTEGAFHWVSDEPVTYSNWSVGEPNDGGGLGTQDFAHIYPPNDTGGRARLWNDISNITSAIVGGVVFEYHGVVEVVPGPVKGLHYAANFEAGAGPEWSNTKTALTPIGYRQFLGNFGNQIVTLLVNNLPMHTNLVVSFDLLIIDTWDGNTGPDVWEVRVAGAQDPILSTTFGSDRANGTRQAYPDGYPGGKHRPRIGGVEFGGMGFGRSTVYAVSLELPHSESSVALAFSASNLQSLGDESWGLDNVKVGCGSAPRVTLNPVSEGGYAAPATINLAGTALDPDGGVTAIEFLANGAVIGSSSNSPFNFTWTNAPAGVWPVAVRATDDSGFSSVATAIVVVNGLRGDYFNNQTLSGVPVTRFDPQINFAWSDRTPDPGISNGSFSARWTGFVVPRYSETYSISTFNDDGVRVWIGNQLLIDAWFGQDNGRHTNQVVLVAGMPYPIRVEYYDGSCCGADMQLFWQSPSEPRLIIPQSQLYPPCSFPPPLTIQKFNASQARIEWATNSCGYKLASANSLYSSNWTTNISAVSSIVTNGFNKVTIDITPGQRFFRLVD